MFGGFFWDFMSIPNILVILLINLKTVKKVKANPKNFEEIIEADNKVKRESLLGS
jgi:hypothetical protein